MKKYKLTPQIKMRMLWIAFGGSIIVALIFAYGFFAMQKENFSNIKQFRTSLDQINSSTASLRHK